MRSNNGSKEVTTGNKRSKTGLYISLDIYATSSRKFFLALLVIIISNCNKNKTARSYEPDVHSAFASGEPNVKPLLDFRHLIKYTVHGSPRIYQVFVLACWWRFKLPFRSS